MVMAGEDGEWRGIGIAITITSNEIGADAPPTNVKYLRDSFQSF